MQLPPPQPEENYEPEKNKQKMKYFHGDMTIKHNTSLT